jgi:ArsR family transcriptional regulator
VESPRLTADEAHALSDDLATLAHPIRLQILGMLAAHEGQVCVCDLEAALPVKQPTVSHHLKLLRDAGLVEVERHGLWAFYSVRREVLAALRDRIASGLAALG